MVGVQVSALPALGPLMADRGLQPRVGAGAWPRPPLDCTLLSRVTGKPPREARCPPRAQLIGSPGVMDAFRALTLGLFPSNGDGDSEPFLCLRTMRGFEAPGS